MNYKNKNLQLKQVDEQLSAYKNLNSSIPRRGWLNSIRTSIGMTAKQLGKKLGISHQAILNLEKREVDNTITIEKLKSAGEAIGLKFVYGFIPNGSLEDMVNARAEQLATKIVMRTSNQMELEDQKIANKKLTQAIKERTKEIIRTMPRNLWD